MKESSNKHKHLEFIQVVINRMASNSFVFKGWSITIIAGISAFATKDSHIELILIPVVATLLFWSVDAYYLMLERAFRRLYSQVAAKNEAQIDFSMAVVGVTAGAWFKTLFRPILLAFYGVIITMLTALLLVLGNVSVTVRYGS